MAPKPNHDQYRALAELHNAVHVNTFLEQWVARATEELVKSNDPVQIYRAQGELGAVSKLIELMRVAPEQLKR